MCCAWRCYINMKNKCELCGCNICKKMVWKSPLPLYFLLDYFTLQHYVIIIISKVLYDHTCHNTQTMHVQHASLWKNKLNKHIKTHLIYAYISKFKMLCSGMRLSPTCSEYDVNFQAHREKQEEFDVISVWCCWWLCEKLQASKCTQETVQSILLYYYILRANISHQKRYTIFAKPCFISWLLCPDSKSHVTFLPQFIVVTWT